MSKRALVKHSQIGNSFHLNGMGMLVGAILVGLLVWFLMKRTAPAIASRTEIGLADIDALKAQLKGRIDDR